MFLDVEAGCSDASIGASGDSSISLGDSDHPDDANAADEDFNHMAFDVQREDFTLHALGVGLDDSPHSGSDLLSEDSPTAGEVSGTVLDDSDSDYSDVTRESITARRKARHRRANISEAGKTRKKRYDASKAGKTRKKLYDDSEAGTARRGSANTSEAGKTRKKRYDDSEAGKTRKKLYDDSEAGKTRKKLYDDSEAGKTRRGRADTSVAGKARRGRANTSEAGKTRKKRYDDSEAGKTRKNRYDDSEAGKTRRRVNTATGLSPDFKAKIDRLNDSLKSNSTARQLHFASRSSLDLRGRSTDNTDSKRLHECKGDTSNHWDFSADIRWYNKNKVGESFNAFCSEVPKIMCWGCGVLLYKKHLKGQKKCYIEVGDVDDSPAAKAFPDFADTIQLRKGSISEVRVCVPCAPLHAKSLAHDRDVRTSGECSTCGTNKRCDGGLQSCNLFLNFGPGEDIVPIRIPAPLAAAAKDFKVCRALSLVKLLWMPPPSGRGDGSFAHFRGSIKKEERPGSDFDGLMGIFYSEEAGGGNLTESQQAVARAALEYFCEHNDLSLDEPGDPGLNPGVCDLCLADIPENGQHKRVGTDLKGYFCPVSNIDPASHAFDIDNLVVGHASASGDGKSISGGGESSGGSKPTSERKSVYFSDVRLEAKTFPCIYYDGYGCYHPNMYKNNRCTTMRPSHMYHARLRSVLDVWRDCIPWCFFQLDWMEKRRIHEAQGVMIRMNRPTISGADLTLSDLASSAEPDSDINRYLLPSSIGGSKAHARTDFLDLCALVGMSGPPDLIMTLTCSEKDMVAVVSRAEAAGRPLRSCPGYVQEHFHRQFGKLFEKVKAGSIFGKVTDWFVKCEYQHRGHSHYHVLVWLENKTDKCKHVAATLPRANMKVLAKQAPATEKNAKCLQALRTKVGDYYVHRHNDVCLVHDDVEHYRMQLQHVVDEVGPR